MRRRDFLLGAPLGMAAWPGRSMAAGSPTLRFVPDSNLSTIDPVWNITPTTRNHGMMVWDTLYGRDAQLRPQPQMAAGHEVSPDGLTWQIALRPGLLFHDGSPVTPADCVASIRRWAVRRPLGQRLLSLLDGMAALDDSRFEVRLRQPFPQLTRALAEFCFIMPERLARTSPGARIPEAIGSGPFRFLAEEWVTGSKAAYARFDRYVPRPEPASFTAGGKVAHFERVEWRIMPDAATAAAALQAGEVDWVQQPPFDLLPVLRRTPGVEVLANDKVGVMGMLALNHLHPPFDDPAARRAVLSVVDQADFMAAAAGDAPGATMAPVGFFTPGMSMANDAGMSALSGPRDLSAARAALAAGGHAGQRLVLLSPADSPVLQSLSLVAADLFGKLGFAVQVDTTDVGTQAQRRASTAPLDKGGWSAFVTTYEGLTLEDPATNVGLRGNGLDAWFGWPTSARLETLRDAWFAAQDETGRKALAADIQRTAIEEVPFVPLGQVFFPTAVRQDITGIVPAAFPIFWNVRRA